MVALHGGEPMLAGREWIGWFLEETTRRVSTTAGVSLNLGLQTNGTLLDRDWVELLGRFDVLLGISCDGPPELHDSARRDFLGRGSYAAVRRAIELLAVRVPTLGSAYRRESCSVRKLRPQALRRVWA